jgi:type IX secretion system PorP/SprF family membrane protein
LDEEGFIKTAASYLSGAYHIRLRFGTDLGIGFSAGMIQKSLDPKWHVWDPDDWRYRGNKSNIAFDAGAGVRLVGKNWYAGISSLHITESKLGWETNRGYIQYPLQRNFWINGGYSFQGLIGERLDLNPAVLVRTDLSKTSLAANLQAVYKKRVFAAVNYRNDVLTAASVMGGFFIKKKLALGYSFDIPTRHASIFGGTHEFMIQFSHRLHSSS